MKDLIDQLKKLNHAWYCSKTKCTCSTIKLEDEVDLGDRIIKEMWDKEKRFINSKNKIK